MLKIITRFIVAPSFEVVAFVVPFARNPVWRVVASLFKSSMLKNKGKIIFNVEKSFKFLNNFHDLWWNVDLLVQHLSGDFTPIFHHNFWGFGYFFYVRQHFLKGRFSSQIEFIKKPFFPFRCAKGWNEEDRFLWNHLKKFSVNLNNDNKL